MRVRLSVLLCIWPLLAEATQYAAPRLHGTADQAQLSYVQDGHRIAAPRWVNEQQGVAQARVSREGRMIGWLVLTPNCCTSYPLPTALVVQWGHQHRVMREGQAIWRWSFGRQPGTVVYVTDLPHGPTAAHYYLRRVVDGKLLAEFDCREATSRHTPPILPDWVRLVDKACPE
ncbi:hypothetical protein [Leeia aquatica]|uniref:Lipoprotein n=1 Tax=Leeia aquatica TaxID=2725557 RepID=A0A847SB27_9NEIS|nr:hypothetical protein [Leeia aquatica]NLR74288.1 hypothetical protein [Leeia aquatica]